MQQCLLVDRQAHEGAAGKALPAGLVAGRHGRDHGNAGLDKGSDLLDKPAAGGFELSRTAGSVKVEVLNGAGRVVDTLDLGTQDAGRHGFAWRAASLPDGAYSFRVVAAQGTQVVPASPLMRDRVEAVRTTGNTLTLETASSGLVAWRDVQGFN